MALANPALNPKKFQQAIDDEQEAGWASPTGGAVSSPPTASMSPPPPPTSTVADGTGLVPPIGEPTAKPMTYGGTFTATLVLFVLLLAGGWYGWQGVKQIPGEINPLTHETSYAISFPGWLLPVLLGAFVLAMVTIFKPKIARFTGPIYAVAEGAVLGAISAVYNLQFDGIVLQAVLATLSVFGVMLFLYATRIIRVTEKFRRTVIFAMLGIFVMYAVSFVAQLFGADIAFFNQPSLLGIGISVVIVIVASLNLMLNFDLIESAVAARAPRYMEWYGAFGLMIALVWLYLEILRLLALLNRR